MGRLRWSVMSVARPSRLRLRSAPELRPGIVAAIGAFLAALAVVAVATQPSWDRWVVAAVIGGSLAAISLDRPRTAALVALLGLPFLALLRRLLIPLAPWTSQDPLLAVGPLLAVVILAGLWIRTRFRLAPDFLSKLVLALLAVALLATLNLNGSGIGTALRGLVFIGLPLLWFFVGRELGDRVAARTLLVGTILVGVGIAVYGLWQTQVGLPSWDGRWLAVAGYNSLYIHHGNEYTIRAFGTFSSAAEYATYLGVAIAIATAFVLHGRWRAALALPVLAVALVFASGRTVLVLTVLAVLIMCALRSRRPRLALSAVGGTLVLAVAVFQFAGPSIADATTKLNNPPPKSRGRGTRPPTRPRPLNTGAALGTDAGRHRRLDRPSPRLRYRLDEHRVERGGVRRGEPQHGGRRRQRFCEPRGGRRTAAVVRHRARISAGRDRLPSDARSAPLGGHGALDRQPRPVAHRWPLRARSAHLVSHWLRSRRVAAARRACG